MITAEQFAEWKTHPVTIEIFSELKKAKQDLTIKLSEGQTVTNDASTTQGLTSAVVGQIKGLDQLLNISYEDSTESEDVDTVTAY